MTDINKLIGFMAIMQVPFMNDPDALMYIEEVKATLKTLKALEWISVKDRLPEENLEYLVYATDEDGERFVTTDHWRKYGRQWYLFDNDSPTTVTHWMPLPEPPKEEA